MIGCISNHEGHAFYIDNLAEPEAIDKQAFNSIISVSTCSCLIVAGDNEIQ